MAASTSPLLQAVLTSAGSLVGVLAGFALDRKVEEKKRRQALAEQLRGIQEELDSNKTVVNGNYRVIADLQSGGGKTDHYALSLCSSSAWEASVGDQIVEEIDSSVYSDLQRIYSQCESLNEQIRRLRTEQLHPQIKEEEVDAFGVEIWTISVRYWEESTGSVQTTGLGDMIQEKCNDIRMDIDEIESKIEKELDDCQSSSSKRGGYPKWKVP